MTDFDFSAAADVCDRACDVLSDIIEHAEHFDRRCIQHDWSLITRLLPDLLAIDEAIKINRPSLAIAYTRAGVKTLPTAIDQAIKMIDKINNPQPRRGSGPPEWYAVGDFVGEKQDARRALKHCEAIAIAARNLAFEQDQGGDGRIPHKYRTKPISKKLAASLLGKPNEDSGVRWLNGCIESGVIHCEKLSKQAFVFDIREFSESVHSKLVPSSPAKSR